MTKQEADNGAERLLKSLTVIYRLYAYKTDVGAHAQRLRPPGRLVLGRHGRQRRPKTKHSNLKARVLGCLR